MKILFLVPYVPNPVRVRSYNFIRHLSARSNQVTVVVPLTSEEDRKDLERLVNFGCCVYGFKLPTWQSLLNALIALPSKMPLQAVYSWHPSISKEFREIAIPGGREVDFDVVHIEHLRGVRYGVDLKKYMTRFTHQIPIIWDSVDCISFLFRQAALLSRSQTNRWITRLELSRTENYEQQVVQLFDRVLVTSEKDRLAFKAMGEKIGKSIENIELIPNGVDLLEFRPADEINREESVLVVSGKMSYHANISMVSHLVDKIMPLVWLEKSDVKLWIVGKDPPSQVKELSRDSRIVVTGTVDEIGPYLQRATLAVSPLTYGAGIQNKVLEALACATPVIASSLAVSALQIKVGEEIVVADTPSEFARAILDLLRNPNRCSQIGKAGLVYAVKHHDWARIVEKLEATYSQTTGYLD